MLVTSRMFSSLQISLNNLPISGNMHPEKKCMWLENEAHWAAKRETVALSAVSIRLM